MMYADSLVRLPDHPVVISDRTSMAHGLETRSPFMDHRLAEFAAQLPEHLKVRGRGLRVIQRRLASRYLPPDVLARPKQGFASALPYLLGAQFQRLFPRVLAGSRLVDDGILRRDTIDRLLQADRDRAADHGVRLWLLVNAELWYRMKILGVTRDAMRQELTEVFAS
jgi:asparagine synthase (glutamine-hydrolysing)